MKMATLDNFISGFKIIIIETQNIDELLEQSLSYLYLQLECKSICIINNDTNSRQIFFSFPRKLLQYKPDYIQKLSLYLEEENNTNFTFDDSYVKCNKIYNNFIIIETKNKLDNQLENSINILIELLEQHLLRLMKIENEKLTDHQLIKQAKSITKAKIGSMLTSSFLNATKQINNSTTEIEIKKKYHQLTDDIFHENIKTIFNYNDEIKRNLAVFESLLNDNGRMSTFTSEYLINKVEKIISSYFDKHNIVLVTHVEKITLKTLENELLESLFIIIEYCASLLIEQEIENAMIFVQWNKTDQGSIITIQNSTHEIYNDNILVYFDPFYIRNSLNNDRSLGLYLAKNVICKQINGTINVSNSQIKHNNTEYSGIKYTIHLKEDNEYN